AINPYQTEGSLTRTIYSFGDQPAVGYRPGSFVNPTLSWERTTQADVGLEFAARSGRISGSVDVYRASTSDLLMNRQLSGINGRSSILQNVGATLNSGVEVALSTQILRNWHDLAWSTQLNWAMNRNYIVSLFGANKDDVGNKWFIGQPISVYYDYQFGGIWQIADSVEMKRYGRKPGDIRVVDQNNDGNPDPRPNLDSEHPDNNNALGFEDGSFVRIRSITLGYTVPGARLGPFRGRSLRFYMTALDPLLFTDFQGLDPESATNAGTPSYMTLMMGMTVGL